MNIGNRGTKRLLRGDSRVSETRSLMERAKILVRGWVCQYFDL